MLRMTEQEEIRINIKMALMVRKCGRHGASFLTCGISQAVGKHGGAAREDQVWTEIVPAGD